MNPMNKILVDWDAKFRAWYDARDKFTCFGCDVSLAKTDEIEFLISEHDIDVVGEKAILKQIILTFCSKCFIKMADDDEFKNLIGAKALKLF